MQKDRHLIGKQIIHYFLQTILFVLLIVGCSTEPNNIYGCTDDSACNFNADANIPDECIYIVDDCGICGGNSSGTCSPSTKAPLNTKELCESGDGFWIPSCD